jgi:hypothetical protein
MDRQEGPLVKRFLIGLVLVALLVVAGASLYVNQILGTAIERGATYALGVDTRVGFVRLRLLDGEFRMSRLRVDNPPGFDEDHFLEMGGAHIAVDLDTVREPVVVVPEFELSEIGVSLEREGEGTNYGVILENLQRFESQEPSEQTAAESGGSEKRFIVDRLLIRDVTAHVEWSKLASDQSALEVVIPQIELKGIGADNAQGVVMSELTNIIIKAILGAIARYGGDIPGAMLSQLNSGLGGLSRVTGVAVTGAGSSLAESAGEAVGGQVGDAIRGVGGSAAESVGEAAADETRKALGGLFKKKGEDSE